MERIAQTDECMNKAKTKKEKKEESKETSFGHEEGQDSSFNGKEEQQDLICSHRALCWNVVRVRRGLSFFTHYCLCFLKA